MALRKKTLRISAALAVAGAVLGALTGPALNSAEAAGKELVEWSSTGPFPVHDVYYPGTEALDPDEMRVVACGTGMPTPRLKQAAACFLVELGNGDKFIFDMGEGSYERLAALEDVAGRSGPSSSP